MMRLILVLLFVFNVIMAQDISHLLKAYPDWKTNFSRHSIDFSELFSGGVPKDGIPAILLPKFENVESARWWLDDVEPVIAVEYDGEAKAYPLQILIWHEIVDDFIGDTPLIVTFCPLCYSAVAFDRRVKNMILTFGVSGLLRNSDLVMYDTLTHSFWQQFTGEGIVGDFTGEVLKIIPAQIVSFEEFKTNYPDGMVLSKDTGFDRAYGLNPYVGYDDVDSNPFLFKGKKDNRLKPNEKVIGIKEAKIYKAFPYSVTSKLKVINDEEKGIKFVVFHSENGAVSSLDGRVIRSSKQVGTTGVFEREIDGKELIFYYEDDLFIDKQTHSKWNALGKCIEGKLKGKQLRRMDAGDYFAFAWLVFVPDTKIYTEE